MRRRTLLAASAGLIASPAWGRAADAADSVGVRLETGQGVIVLALAARQAPLTCANFLRYVDTKRLDGAASFYRRAGVPEVGLVEGGLQNDPKRLLKPVAHESTLVTGLHHVAGTLSMARGKPGDATCDFFICMGPSPALDARADGEGDIAGYAAFGAVSEGMDVVAKIHALPTSEFARNPVMKGEMLQAPVPILQATRVV